MSGTGWEFYSVNFSVIFTMIALVFVTLGVMFGTIRHDKMSHLDTMAGDEGED